MKTIDHRNNKIIYGRSHLKNCKIHEACVLKQILQILAKSEVLKCFLFLYFVCFPENSFCFSDNSVFKQLGLTFCFQLFF